MKINITNKDIFFAVENCWEQLDYKLKYQLNQLVSQNSEDDFVQEIEINAAMFILIMKAVNGQPQGVSKDVNPAMHLKLKEQIMQQAAPVMAHLQNLSDEKEIEDFKELHKDILEIAENVQLILQTNLKMLEAKILNGKTQILA
jgi:hypothetical protein